MDSIYDHACVVEMRTLEDAERACDKLHDTKFDGTYVGVKVMLTSFFFLSTLSSISFPIIPDPYPSLYTKMLSSGGQGGQRPRDDTRRDGRDRSRDRGDHRDKGSDRGGDRGGDHRGGDRGGDRGGSRRERSRSR